MCRRYDDKRRLAKHILPKQRTRKAKAITRADVANLMAPIAAEAPVEANRVLALVSGLFSFAVDQGVVDHHPCLQMKKPAARNTRASVPCRRNASCAPSGA